MAEEQQKMPNMQNAQNAPLQTLAAFKSGFAVIAGLANAGKSTLLNKFAGVDLSPVTHKPQTTRQNILAICEGENYQIIYVDTPGFLHAEYKLQEIMLNSMTRAVKEDADVVIFVYDATVPISRHLPLIKKLKELLCPVILVINKIDLVKSKDELVKITKMLSGELEVKEAFFLNAKAGKGVKELQKAVAEYIPFCKPYFPKGQLTDRWERFYIAEFIREQIFLLYSQEIPYSACVEVKEFKALPKGKSYIRAVVRVERDSQKAVIIGAGGRAIAKLRQRSQDRINEFLKQKYRLELRVETAPDWRRDDKCLRQFGYLN